jgi:lysophospholipase L1-like esterase
MPSTIKPEDFRGLDDYLPNDIKVNFTRSAADHLFSQRLATRGLIPVANRAMIGTALSSGASQAITYRTVHYSRKNSRITGPRLVYGNFYMASSGETAGNAAITVKSAIEYNGVSYPIYYGGSRTKVLAVNESVVSDRCAVSIPANTQFAIRTYVSVGTLGEKWPVGNNLTTGIGESYIASDVADGTTSMGTNSAAAFAPLAILGSSSDDAPSVLIIGSSSAWGQGDTSGGGGDTYDYGYLSRALNNTYCYTKFTRASTTMNQFLTTAGYTKQLDALLKINPTHIFQQLGSNDLTGGASYATMVSRITDMADILSSTGAKVIQKTYTPVTTSSDSWATQSGQTLASSNTIRLAINDWLKSMPLSTISAVADCCKFVEDPLAPGYWKTDGAAGTYTADGTHLTPFAHAGTAATLDFSDILTR